MDNNNVFALANYLKSHKGQFGAHLLALTTEHRLLKRQFAASPLAGRQLRKLTVIDNPVAGWSYARVVQARATPDAASVPAQGQFSGPTPQYVPVPPSGMESVPGYEDILYRGLKDPTKFYIRFYIGKFTKTTTQYVFVDGNGRITEATPAEETIIKGCLSAPREFSAKQAALGVENEVIPRAYAADSIVTFRMGDFVL
jgi:hypothetical protein